MARRGERRSVSLFADCVRFVSSKKKRTAAIVRRQVYVAPTKVWSLKINYSRSTEGMQTVRQPTLRRLVQKTNKPALSLVS